MFISGTNFEDYISKDIHDLVVYHFSCTVYFYTDVNLPNFMPDEDKNFGDPLVLHFRK